MIEPLTDDSLKRIGISSDRVRILRAGSPVPDGKFVLYWMQASIRERWNSALEFANLLGAAIRRPTVVLFSLTDDYPGANLRHYQFLLESLDVTAKKLRQRGIRFVVRIGRPVEEVEDLASLAAALVIDVGYTPIQQQWRASVVRRVKCPIAAIEDNVVVPVDQSSMKEEYAARTIRPKILSQIDDFVTPIRRTKPYSSVKLGAIDDDASQVESLVELLSSMSIDHSVSPVSTFPPGEDAARRRLGRFLRDGIHRYDQRNDPTADATSRLSPYLHFGCISPVEIAMHVMGSVAEHTDDFIEQIVVRRELAVNFTLRNPQPMSFHSIPDWAKTTLDRHRRDRREIVYTFEQFRDAATGDPAWNAAQTEMVETGYMSGYMRMYWGKKVIEWSRTPEEAYETLVRLNDAYELDGRDANGYAGIAWCFGRHDRPFRESPVTGTLRPMSYAGLKRKFDLSAYIERCSSGKLNDRPLVRN